MICGKHVIIKTLNNLKAKRGRVRENDERAQTGSQGARRVIDAS